MKITGVISLALILLTSLPLFAQDPIQVACVGNSITYGAGIGSRLEDAYPAALQKLLGDGYYVENCGNSGRTLLKNGDFPLWVEPEFKTAIEMKPDIVVILLGTNDSKPQNWAYKDEFVPDYIAMIDTFRAVNSETQIYACLPPPAFSVQWGIRDSVITTDIIPMIQKIADSTNVHTIDFYTPFTEKNELFPDDIHPDVEGSWEMAQVVYTALTGKTVSTMVDENVARTASVQTQGLSSASNLTDGNVFTLWECSQGDWAVLDLGADIEIDLFQLYFPYQEGYQPVPYTIEISSDSSTWTSVVEVSGNDSTLVSQFPVEPVTVRYVKLSVADAAGDLAIADFRIFKAAPLHAPAFYINDINPSSRFTRYKYYVLPASDSGYMKILRSNNPDEPFAALKGYRPSEKQDSNGSVRPDRIQRYVTMAYDNGVQVVAADTLTVDWSISSVNAKSATLIPEQFELAQNFPNPFNSQTRIHYVLPQASRVEVTVFNVNGQRIRNLVGATKTAGLHTVTWNGVDEHGNDVPSGVYFYQLQVDGKLQQIRRMVLLR